MVVIKKEEPFSQADIYILHGDDALAANDRIDEICQLLREKGLVDTDITQLGGSTATISDLSGSTSMLLLGGSMRLLLVDHALELVKNKADQEWFSNWLGNLPPDQALVLVVPDSMKFDGKKKVWVWQQVGEAHWLRAALEAIPKKTAWMDVLLPSEKEMAGWIMQEAKRQGVSFEPHAAAVLASQVGNDTFTARQEVHKAQNYTLGERAVTAEDVRLLCAADRETGVFDMVDAVGRRDGRTALGLLHRLLEEEAAIYVFNMLARQVRLLIMAKEMVEVGSSEREIISGCGVQPFVARKLAEQCRCFHMDELESFYRRLDHLDEESKRGFASLDTGMEILVAQVSRA